jgi:tetrahydromethanopterin:alpha-L-glutamate ligase
MALQFALVSAHAREDWHLRRLASALSSYGDVERVEPSRLRLVCGREAGTDRVVVWANGKDARRFSAVLLGRVVGPHADADLQLDAARALALCDVPSFNAVQAMLDAQDKLWTAALLARAGLPTPLCSSVPRTTDLAPALSQVADGAGMSVLKPLFGSLGEGLARVSVGQGRAPLLRAVREGPHLVQRYVDTGGSDHRLFVVGHRVEACITRRSAPGEWRSNAARHGVAIEARPPRRWTDIAIEAARSLGLSFAGVDLAVGPDGPTILEVNGFPSFRAIHRVTGRDMAQPIAAHVAREASRRVRMSRRTIAAG